MANEEKKVASSVKYRADDRTVEQFKADIIEGNRIELEIIQRYCKITGHSYVQLGHDDGEFKEKSNSIADFIVNGEPLEVKFCRNDISRFHLKKHHVDQYIKQGAKILFVMNYDETPMYTIIDPKSVTDYPVKVFWKKLSYFCKKKDFQWTPL